MLCDLLKFKHFQLSYHNLEILPSFTGNLRHFNTYNCPLYVLWPLDLCKYLGRLSTDSDEFVRVAQIYTVVRVSLERRSTVSHI